MQLDDEPRHIIKATRVLVKPNLFCPSPGRQTYKHTATEMAAGRRFIFPAYSGNYETVGILYKIILFP